MADYTQEQLEMGQKFAAMSEDDLVAELEKHFESEDEFLNESNKSTFSASSCDEMSFNDVKSRIKIKVDNELKKWNEDAYDFFCTADDKKTIFETWLSNTGMTDATLIASITAALMAAVGVNAVIGGIAAAILVKKVFPQRVQAGCNIWGKHLGKISGSSTKSSDPTVVGEPAVS
nr:hypothetical protein [uncultured Holophaga sp.]